MSYSDDTTDSSILTINSPKRAFPPTHSSKKADVNENKTPNIQIFTCEDLMLSPLPEPILARSPPVRPSRNLFGSITKVDEYKEQGQQETTHDVRCSSPKKLFSSIKRFSLISALTPTKKDRVGVVEGAGSSGLSSTRNFKSGSRLATPSKNVPEDKERMGMSPAKDLSTFKTPLELVSSPPKQCNSSKVERIGEAHLLSSPSRQVTSADTCADTNTARPREIPSSKNLSTYVMSPFKKLSLASISSPSKTGKSVLRKGNMITSPSKISGAAIPEEIGYEHPTKGISEFGVSKDIPSTSDGPTTSSSAIPVLPTPRDCLIEYLSTHGGAGQLEEVPKKVSFKKMSSLKSFGNRLMDIATYVFHPAKYAKKKGKRVHNLSTTRVPCYQSRLDVSDDEFEPVSSISYDSTPLLSSFRRKVNPTFARVFSQTPKVERSATLTKIPRRRSFGSLISKNKTFGSGSIDGKERNMKVLQHVIKATQQGHFMENSTNQEEGVGKLEYFRAKFIDKVNKAPISPLACSRSQNVFAHGDADSVLEVSEPRDSNNNVSHH